MRDIRAFVYPEPLATQAQTPQVLRSVPAGPQGFGGLTLLSLPPATTIMTKKEMLVDTALREDAFRGRTALVVGGTSGIGAAAASLLAKLGAQVIAGGLDPHLAPVELAHNAQVVALDVTAEDDLRRLVEDLSALDILVNCAGIIARRAEYRLDVFSRVLEVNLVGTMRACTAAHPLLKASRGCIVNVASMLSFFGGPLVPGYSASKGGVAQLTKSLAIAFAEDGIRVNAVAPGWIRTDLTAGLREDPEAERRLLDRTPLGRWGEPEDIAGAIAFLASPDARFITGTVVPVDGGYHAN